MSGDSHGCRRQIPDADCSVRSRRRDLLPVRADDDVVNHTGVAGKAQSIRTVGSIPQPDDAGIAAANHQSFVTAQSDRRNWTDLTGQQSRCRCTGQRCNLDFAGRIARYRNRAVRGQIDGAHGRRMTGDRPCRHLRQLPDSQRSVGACRVQLLTGRIVRQPRQSTGMSFQ